MRVYFAHSVSDYDTAWEEELLRKLIVQAAVSGRWIEVVNPNHAWHQEGYRRAGMDYFINEVLPTCDGCIFVRLPNGKHIGAGVAKEIQWFLDNHLPVWEADPLTGTCQRIEHLSPEDTLSIEQTRAVVGFLKECANGGRT